MSTNINKVMISGNLSRDGELKATAGGTSVLSFSVAVGESRRDQNGEWKDYANFVNCTLFGKRADALAQYLTKGTKVALVGRLHQSRWETREGGKRSTLEILVDEIEIMTSRNNGRGEVDDGSQATAESGGYSPAYASEDLPF